jgi:hypothetical protein
MADEPLEAARDELYSSDTNEFVEIRKRLAAALVASGDKVGAKELRAARRPSTSAWALNQLARRDPELIAVLLEQSAGLVAAQTRALSGRPEAMRDAMRAHRDALDATTDAALEILGVRANDGFRSEIVSTLRAASTDEEVGRLLTRGRLIREESSSGFPDATGLTLVPSPERPKPTAKSKTAPREAPAHEQLAELERAVSLAAAADRDAAQAHARIQQLQRELDAARQELNAALARSRTAKKEVAKLASPRDRS